MAIVVLFSTMSFTISSHFCGNTVVDVSYFSKASSCGMEMKQDVNNKDCSITKKNCCKDVTKVIEGQDNLKKNSFDSLSQDQQLFLATFYYSYINLFEGLHSYPLKIQRIYCCTRYLFIPMSNYLKSFFYAQ